MKHLLFALLATTIGFSAFASTEVEETALKTLIAANATVTENEATVSVNDLILSNMLSSFDDKGKGTLAVSENTCVKESAGVYNCRLTMSHSGRRTDTKGALIIVDKLHADVEAVIMFEYKVGPKGLIGKVEITLAG